jgi:hypothetical protein
MAAGAVAGAAAGLYLGRKYRSMDAFLADVRERFADLRDIWNDEALSLEDRARLGGSDVADVDEWDDDDYDDDLDEDELEDSAYENAEAFGDDDSEATLDDYDDDEVDDFEEELAAVTRTNGDTDAARRNDDATRRLEKRVLESLQNEPVLSARAIEIAVVGDGVVELTGAVHAIEEVARASSLARSVPGVTMVLNRIVVRSGGNIDTASVPRNPVEAPVPDELLDPND